MHVSPFPSHAALLCLWQGCGLMKVCETDRDIETPLAVGGRDPGVRQEAQVAELSGAGSRGGKNSREPMVRELPRCGFGGKE